MQHRTLIILLLFCFTPVLLRAQPVIDTTRKPGTASGKLIQNLATQAYNSVYKPEEEKSIIPPRSEAAYMPYKGKIIRNISVVSVNFDRSLHDTSVRNNSLPARIGNHLHLSTRRFVIRNNLFIRENTPVNPYMVADNERFIRALEYINDVRIIIDPIPDNPDSVDIRVLTKDLFSIGGGVAANGLSRINAELYDANLAGMGQRLSITGLYDEGRSPQWGYGGYYRKNNVGHSYIDATIGHSVMSVNPYTRLEESTDYITLERRLVSPYSRFAGGLTLSTNHNYNVYNMPDSIYYGYRYRQMDGWAGYAIGIRRLTRTNNEIRDRRFLAVRLYDRTFTQVPLQRSIGYDPVFNSSRAALAQLTFYRQDYYKTRYIYGFGTTEDLPHGYNISVSGGLHEQLDLRRPYAGLSATRYTSVFPGDFVKLSLKTGGFLHNGTIQDGSLLAGISAFSPLFRLQSTYIRQYLNVSYTQLFNRVTYAPLYLNNYYGLRGFISDSAYGSQRLSLQLETAFFLKFRLLGFRFAPFPWGDIAIIRPEGSSLDHAKLYSSLGAGIRTRNENLAFETIEVRAYFFPVAPDNMRGFKVMANAHVRFRYRTNYITAPDFVQLNQE